MLGTDLVGTLERAGRRFPGSAAGILISGMRQP